MSTIEGRTVKFYSSKSDAEPSYEYGTMHQWFLVGESVITPYALIEKEDGTMVLVNYHDVIFVKSRSLLDLICELNGEEEIE